MKRSLHYLLLGIIGSILCPLLTAVQPRKAMDDRYEDFTRGKPEGVSITSDGRLVLGPEIKKFADIPAAHIWGAVTDSDGNLYVGTGKEGKIFKVSNQGEVSLYFESKSTAIYALCSDSKGIIYAASSPSGKVWKITGPGKATEFFDPKAGNIWAMVLDDTGHLYVATGDKGLIYKINSEGQGTIFYDSDEPNIISLTLDREGNLLAGSQGNGLLYRINQKGEAFVILSSGHKEIKKVSVDEDGIINLIALGGTGSTGKAGTTSSSPSPDALLKALAGAVPGGTLNPDEKKPPTPDISSSPDSPLSSTPDDTFRDAPTVLIRIEKSGSSDTIWSTRSTAHSLVRLEKGWFVGSGDEGLIYHIGKDKKAMTLARLESSQITALLPVGDEGEIMAIGSNPARLWKLNRKHSRIGSYESEVFDSRGDSHWGKMTAQTVLPEETKITFETRTGNTSKPDKTWTSWSALQNGQVQSPSSRYFQYRIRMEGTSIGPEVHNVSLYYLPRNLAPKISKITLSEPGQSPLTLISQQNPFALMTVMKNRRNGSNSRNKSNTPAGMNMPGQPQPPSFSPSTRAVTWQATDLNNDTLTHTVEYREIGDKEWTLLEKDIADSYFLWDTAGWPDGRYEIRITSTDEDDNPDGLALSTNEISPQFEIDNTAPVIEISETSKDSVRFIVRDRLSLIEEVSYSTDGKEYTPLLPDDKIPDSVTEDYMLKIPGNRTLKIFIKAQDAAGNTVAIKVDPDGKP